RGSGGGRASSGVRAVARVVGWGERGDVPPLLRTPVARRDVPALSPSRHTVTLERRGCPLVFPHEGVVLWDAGVRGSDSADPAPAPRRRRRGLATRSSR